MQSCMIIGLRTYRLLTAILRLELFFGLIFHSVVLFVYNMHMHRNYYAHTSPSTTSGAFI